MQLIQQAFSWQAQNAILTSIMFDNDLKNSDNGPNVTGIGVYPTLSANSENDKRATPSKPTLLCNE